MAKFVYAVTGGCTLCGMCLYECPAGAIAMEQTGARIDGRHCTGCGRCARNCASEAIRKTEKTEVQA
ncbi:MAG: methyl-viologen-reducing hydrogenase delta subunit [Paenibacillaceae bacterium]|jgi:ferredoxin|nr:methyl-viologen-reducing hydrogenase delta subunit [Paenibacillaceae bacterium]